MFKKKKIFLIALSTVILIFAIPFLIDWLIIGNNIPSNIKNSEWVEFLGGYIGAIIGAAVSLIGIVITIKYTNEQNKKDRELQIRPYCTVRYVPTPKTISTRKELACLMIGCEPQANNGPRYSSVIYIKNIGLGPAIKFNFTVDDIDDGRVHYPIIPQRTPETVNNAVDLLQPGEEAIVPINIWFNFDPIDAQDLIDVPGLGKTPNHEVSSKYKNFTIRTTVTYCDMYENKFSQQIFLKSNMYTKGSSDGVWSHECDINLEKTTQPIKIEK